jgi:hypothetical protein
MSELVSVFNVTDSTIAWPVGVSPLVPDGVTDNSPNLNAMIAALLDPGGITPRQRRSLGVSRSGNRILRFRRNY